MKRLLSLLSLVLVLVSTMLAAPAAEARIGFGDPIEPFREREPDETVIFHGHLRLRSAGYSNLDLDRGPSPSTGKQLWPNGVTPADLTAGSDLRVRLAPSIFLGEDVRVFIEVDLLDNIALGQAPKGTPYAGRTAVVAGTAFQEPVTAAMGAFRVRSAMAEARLPFGFVAAGRMPSHFGLGIAANSGDDLDDDGGDRADRVAFVTPLFGHYVAASFDWAATGPALDPAGIAPAAGSPSDDMHALSFALLHFRAPWEVELYRDANRFVFDYGIATSLQWQLEDAPGFYQELASEVGLTDAERVSRDYFAVVVDAWARADWGPLTLETEAVASHFNLSNPSPYPGVDVRTPVTGNPFGAVVKGTYRALDEGLLTLGAQTGVASADPGEGFPLLGPSAFAGGRPGDVYGSQLDGTRDTRMDAFRFHPAYRVDLIMWRTLLGGVSEAAYARGHVKSMPIEGLELELSGIYSHGLAQSTTPGGVGPLGAELDAAVTFYIGQFSLRADYGVLVPFGGLGARGGAAPGLAQMALVRLGFHG